MTAELRFRVTGEPGPQGSKRHVGRGIMVESSKKVKPWRQDVAAAAEKAATEQDWQSIPQVRVVLVFGFRRPKAHYGTGRNATVLKPSAPYWHANKPDADKLARSTLDALTTAAVIGDDCQVVDLAVFKIWLNGDQSTGAYIALAAPQPWLLAGVGDPFQFPPAPEGTQS